MSNTILFSGSAHKEFAQNVAKHFGCELGNVKLQQFSDGEIQASYEETVRGKEVYIIQPTYSSDSIMELMIMLDAAKRASASKITAVLPYYGYARQDRKDRPRVAIGAKLVAKMLAAAGANRIMTMDLHADQIQGFFSFPIDHMFASSVFLPYLEAQNIDKLTIVAPDTGATKRANNYAKYLNADLAICYKQRKVANEVSEMTLIGEVKGRNVIIMDDMIDTAGTMCKAAQMIADQGALSVSAMCSHAVLSGPAYERISESILKELIVTDSIPLKEGKDISKIKVLSVAKLFADVIKSVENHESISTQFIQ
ncbi:MAG: ribose-phosphate pyrophosphokinase [Urechidicola sp.]|jgi:ribose-phosphate pyrophosphokinase|tara:strand:+ start:8439 stop:9371 length:933 start_codon:yes stop_codon:yes gene_type:complete